VPRLLSESAHHDAVATGDITTVRPAAEVAHFEEIPRLDLAPVRQPEGHLEESEPYLRGQVCNRSDDDAPEDLSERIQAILRHREWFNHAG